MSDFSLHIQYQLLNLAIGLLGDSLKECGFKPWLVHCSLSFDEFQSTIRVLEVSRERFRSPSSISCQLIPIPERVFLRPRMSALCHFATPLFIFNTFSPYTRLIAKSIRSKHSCSLLRVQENMCPFGACSYPLFMKEYGRTNRFNDIGSNNSYI
jgi:hypothetical protein